MSNTPPLKLAIGSLGAVGLDLAERLLDGAVPGTALVAISARDQAAASKRLSERVGEHQVATMGLAELSQVADVVIECAPAAVFRELVEPAVEAGRTIVIISVGALLSHWDLVEKAKSTGARIIAPSGAILGLDALRAAAQGTIYSVKMVTRKPPRGLLGAPHLEAIGLDVMSLTEATCVFTGTAREAALAFPANVNVAAAVALAGPGPDDTTVEVWADPAVERNIHRIEVDSDTARFEMLMQNIPSDANPATGRIVAPSVVAALQRLTAAFVVGT